MRALANALSVVKKDAKAAEQERRESEKKAREIAAKNERETNAQRRSSKGKDDADDGRSRLKCAHPDCEFAVHADPAVSESFCCGKCAASFLSEPRAEPSHGKRCEGVLAGRNAERARPRSNDMPVWGSDVSDKKGRKGKGKGKGKREAKGEPLSQDFESLDPEELDRRRKRAARFGGKDEATPAAPEPADIPLPAGQAKSTESKPTEKVGREEKSKNKTVSRGLRAWSDDENGQVEESDGKLERVEENASEDAGLRSVL